MNQSRFVMGNSSKGFNSSRINNNYTPYKSSNAPRSLSGGKKGSIRKILMLFLFSIFLIIGLSAFGRYYFTIYKNLPDIKTIDKISFSQKSTILSKYGDVLYTIYDENRKEVPFDQIGSNMVNAIVSAEDQRFWTNPGVDFMGLVRVGINEVRKTGPAQGGSTLTQQVIKNLLLTNEKSIDRKLKEMTLAFQLNEYLKNKISQTGRYSSQELDRKVKEKILELYLNFVFFGNNNYGVEIASRSYFGVAAKDLSPMQAAILASIPQAPSKYDPYTQKAFLAGELTISNSQGDTFPVTTGNKSAISQKITTLLTGKVKKGQNSNDTLAQLDKIKDIPITLGSDSVKLTYNRGRKDYVLARMMEDGYIDENQFIQAIIDTTDLKFKRLTQEIKAPHFVNYVLDILRNDPNIGEEKLRKGGLVIKTTLDTNMQDIAEKAITENMTSIRSKGGNNSAFIMVDSKNGDVLAYVGSADFNNEDIDGETDILNYGIGRQPGSTMKPFMYAYNIWKNGITESSPIFDIKLKIGNNTPNNADGSFEGYEPIKFALAHSRNIPAIVMYFLAGQEKVLKPYLISLGMKTIDLNHNYGYPLAIGAGEIKPIELANAYMHLSAMGQPAKINPIQEIKTLNGNIVYEKKVEYQARVLPYGVAYIIWDILSDNNNLPAGWKATHIINGLKIARKSGTTNVGDLARDGWFATYTPSKVGIFWAGNTDGTPMKSDAYGGWLNAEAYQSIYKQYLAKGFVTNETVEPQEVKTVSIDKYCGTLNGGGTKISSLAYINSLPPDTQGSCYAQVQVDKLCNGKVTSDTPTSDIITINVPKSNPLYNSLTNIDYPAKIAASLGGAIGDNSYNPTKICSRPKTGSISISVSQPGSSSVGQNFTVSYSVTSNVPLQSTSLSVGGNVVSQVAGNGQTSISNSKAVSVNPGDTNLTITATDTNGYSTQKSFTVSTLQASEDTTPPYFAGKKVTNNGDVYIVNLRFADKESKIAKGTISQDGNILSSFQQAVVTVKTTSQSPISYTVTDSNGNTANGSVSIK